MDWANITKNTYCPTCQTLLSPVTSMRCTKTISRQGMARSLLNCCSLTKARSSVPLRAIAAVSDTLF